jgi:hypothetical protein
MTPSPRRRCPSRCSSSRGGVPGLFGGVGARGLWTADGLRALWLAPALWAPGSSAHVPLRVPRGAPATSRRALPGSRSRRGVWASRPLAGQHRAAGRGRAPWARDGGASPRRGRWLPGAPAGEPTPADDAPTVPVAVVQGNIPQEGNAARAGDPSTDGALTAPPRRGVDSWWPEAAMPAYVRRAGAPVADSRWPRGSRFWWVPDARRGKVSYRTARSSRFHARHDKITSCRSGRCAPAAPLFFVEAIAAEIGDRSRQVAILP